MLVGILLYLYFPIGDSTLWSSVIISSEVEKETEDAPVLPISSPDSVVAERMKFTALLLRYQKKLAEAESDKNAQNSSEIIQSLKTKIAHLEKMIRELAQ